MFVNYLKGNKAKDVVREKAKHTIIMSLQREFQHRSFMKANTNQKECLAFKDATNVMSGSKPEGIRTLGKATATIIQSKN